MDDAIKGIIAFNATPSRNGAIDLDRLRSYFDYQLDQGVHGMALFGSTGGLGSFDAAARLEAAKVAVDQAKGRGSIVVGVGSPTTAEAVDLAKAAEDAGAAAALVVPFSYWPLTDNELFDHYAAIAGAISMPVIVYNNPGTTGIDIKPHLLGRMAEIGNIKYVKDSSCDMARVTQIQLSTKGRISVFNGNDACTPEAFLSGAIGWAAGTASMYPARCVAIYNAAAAKDFALVHELFQPLFPLTQLLGSMGYIRVAHSALEILGRPVGPPIKPVQMLSGSDLDQLTAVIRQIGEV